MIASIRRTERVPAPGQLTDRTERFETDVLRGLRRQPKSLPCKYLSDAIGEHLFERICDLPEYYLTRTECTILAENAPEIARLLGTECVLVEYGSGAGLKTRILLDHLRNPTAYVPVDLAVNQLRATSARLEHEYSGLDIRPLAADFTGLVRLPFRDLRQRPRAIFFPGSTIGNFSRNGAKRLLQRMARVSGPGGKLLVGVDLRKDARVLEAAYDDSQGVTAAFNRNLLERINRELAADFRVDRFSHHAFYDGTRGRVEMQLIAQTNERVHVGGIPISIRQGEAIRTERCHKYSWDELRALGAGAGLRLAGAWTDEGGYFAVCCWTARPG
jgi:dimethylhistidine N-methyltransferase